MDQEWNNWDWNSQEWQHGEHEAQHGYNQQQVNQEVQHMGAQGDQQDPGASEVEKVEAGYAHQTFETEGAIGASSGTFVCWSVRPPHEDPWVEEEGQGVLERLCSTWLGVKKSVCHS